MVRFYFCIIDEISVSKPRAHNLNATPLFFFLPYFSLPPPPPFFSEPFFTLIPPLTQLQPSPPCWEKHHFSLENFPKNRGIKYIKNTITTQKLMLKTPKLEKNHNRCLKTTRE